MGRGASPAQAPRRAGRRWLLPGAGAAVVVAVVLAVVLAVRGGGQAPRARQYLAVTACLLTDSRGLAVPQAAAAWSGMERASAATRAQVELFSVPGGAAGSTSAAGAARPVLASMALRRCVVVVTAGQVPVAAVSAVAGEFRAVRFVVVGASGGATSARGNVSAVSGSAAAIRSGVASAVIAATNGAG